MNADKVRAVAWAVVGLAIVSVIASFVIPAILPSIQPNPVAIFVVLAVVGGLSFINSLGGGGGGATNPRRPGNVDAAAAHALMLDTRRADRERLIEFHRAGLIDDEQLDRSLKHLLDSPIPSPPSKRP